MEKCKIKLKNKKNPPLVPPPPLKSDLDQGINLEWPNVPMLKDLISKCGTRVAPRPFHALISRLAGWCQARTAGFYCTCYLPPKNLKSWGQPWYIDRILVYFNKKNIGDWFRQVKWLRLRARLRA